jgi:hypothetical protein
MYGKPAMTCFKCQVYFYGSEAITYLIAILWLVQEPVLQVIIGTPTPTIGSPPPLYGSITFTHLEQNFSLVKLP